MIVRQISVFLENRSGRLREVAAVLGANGINIRALTLADTRDYGVLRLIVDNPDAAREVLRREHFTMSETEVIAVEVADRPGALSQVLDIFGEAGINVEYMYGFVETVPGRALTVFRVEDAGRAVRELKARNIPLADKANPWD
jgi:hypothetical protein